MNFALIKAEQHPPALIDNLLAPEIFASSVASYSLTDGVLTIVLASTRFDATVSPAERKLVVIGRICMPVTGAHTLTVGLHNFLEQSGATMPGVPERRQMQ